MRYVICRHVFSVAALIAVIGFSGCATDEASREGCGDGATCATASADTPAKSAVTASTSVLVQSYEVTTAWNGVFAVQGSVLPISLTIAGLDADAAVKLTAAGQDSAPVTATFEPVSQMWNADLPIPTVPLGTELDVVVDIETAGVRSHSTLTLPVAVNTPVDVKYIDITLEVVATLAWGDGPAEVGTSGGNEGEVSTPTAFAVDSETGTLAVLDNVNQRLVVTSTTGQTSEVPLPGANVALADVVLNGESGTVTVVGWASFGPPTTTAFIVDLATLEVETLGPAALPQQAPFNTPFVFNTANQQVYGLINNRYYPYLDFASRTLAPSTATIGGFEATATLENAITVGFGSSIVSLQFPGSIGGLRDVQPQLDGSIWFLHSSIETNDLGEATVDHRIVRVDPTTGTAIAASVPGAAMEFTRRLVVAGAAAYIMRASTDGLVIERYRLP